MPRSQEFQIADIPNLSGYVALVTGGNGGIGYETTLHLARHGARVYIASRSQERVQEAIAKMRNAEGKLDLHFLRLDLQDLQSVKAAAADFLQKESRLDILINNAGIMNSPYSLTKDGYEIQWQTNFLSHHALTVSLLPLLRSTAALHPNDKGRVRVVNVSSELAIHMAPKSINYADPNLSDVTGAMAPMRRYGHCKLASIMTAKALTERYHGEGVTAYSLHPGVIKSGLQSHDTSFLGTILRIGVRLGPSSSALDGSRTSLFCATSPRAPEHAGAYFQPFGKLDRRPEKWTRDADAVSKLWELANAQVKANGFVVEL